MTINDLLKIGAEKLNSFGKDDAEFDSRCLLQHILNFDTTQLMLNRSEIVDEKAVSDFLKLIDIRISGEPLQYILGKWEFMGLPFYIGEGVLIPRPETEMLVELAEKFLISKKNPVVFDLCSGSGCIAVSVAKLFPNATVYAVEKSDIAFSYLEKNIILNGVLNVNAVKGDIFDKSILSGISPDLIHSNPPYIRSKDIDELQVEVKKEPVMALDGGEDGLSFYRILAEFWLKKLNENGMLAVECGEDQTEDIKKMFSNKTQAVKSFKDDFGLPRIVAAKK